MSKAAIALYLGESYATLSLFDIGQKSSPVCLFEKSVFLPQVSLKNLLNQCKTQCSEFLAAESPDFFIVTKYFDRLKQFRLGGSISQVVLKGFENSYTLSDSKSLSLAANQLIIALEPQSLSAEFLQAEMERVKKINPDLNKVIMALPEESLTAEQYQLLHDFFKNQELKVFTCSQSHDQGQLRRTLLNAGSEGTREEIFSEITELYGDKINIHIYTLDGFSTKVENCELFASSENFLSAFTQMNKHSCGAYFDIETFKFIYVHRTDHWQSPWGQIPLQHADYRSIGVHPLAEVKLSQSSLLSIDDSHIQLEPGPVAAGRAIKPLVMDLFYEELQANDFASQLFSQLKTDPLKAKLKNLFSVLEKGQKNEVLFLTATELKWALLESIHHEIDLYSDSQDILCFGPLSEVFCAGRKTANFSWGQAILDVARKQGAL